MCRRRQRRAPLTTPFRGASPRARRNQVAATTVADDNRSTRPDLEFAAEGGKYCQQLGPPAQSRPFKFRRAVLHTANQGYDKLYSPQMVVTANTTKYTIENDLTKKEKKENKQTNTQTNGIYLSKTDQLVIKQDM